jgi:hypothetical protein
MSINENGTIEWDAPEAGIYPIKIWVYESDNPSVRYDFNHTLEISSNDFNLAPYFVSAPYGQTASKDHLFSFQLEAADYDMAGALTFSGPNVSSSGLFEWTPTTIDSQTFTVTVTDSTRSSNTTFSLSVIENSAPDLEDQSTSTGIGRAVQYQVEAGEPDQEPLTFSLGDGAANIDGGLFIDPISGELTWLEPDQTRTIPVIAEDIHGLIMIQTMTM